MDRRLASPLPGRRRSPSRPCPWLTTAAGGLTLKLWLKLECWTPDHADATSFVVAERYDGLRGQPRVALVDGQGRVWHYDQAEVKVAPLTRRAGEKWEA
jgi:hypothetical protein